MPETGEATPERNARQNIVVIADEAHRSKYGFGGKANEKTGEASYGFATNMRDVLPNASFIGFTDTAGKVRRMNEEGRMLEGAGSSFIILISSLPKATGRKL